MATLNVAPPSLAAAHHMGDLYVTPGTVDLMDYTPFQHGDEIVKLCNNPVYVFRLRTLEAWWTKRAADGLTPVALNPLTSEPITKQEDIVRYKAYMYLE